MTKKIAITSPTKVTVIALLLEDIIARQQTSGKKIVEDESMTVKEKVKNNVMLKMKFYLDSVAMDILSNVLIQELSIVEVVETETLPATADDTNEYIIELFRLQKNNRLSEKTIKYYVDTIHKLINVIHKPLTKMDQTDIERYLISLEKNNTAVSINNQRRNISAFFTWMRKSRIVIENPCENIDPYRQIEKPIDHMEPEEFEQLKDGCEHKRDRALIEFLRSTAMRVGEVESTKISDINWRSGEVSVYGHKTGEYRTAYLDTVAITYLQDYLEERRVSYHSDEPIFTHVRGNISEGLSVGGIRTVITGIRKRAELKRRVYPHLFRKTTATNVVRRGGSIHDAGEYLGHRERSTAGKHYVGIDKEHTHDIFRKYVAAV